MEQTECYETSAYKIQTPGNYPEENIQHTEHGESLKSRIFFIFENEFWCFLKKNPGTQAVTVSVVTLAECNRYKKKSVGSRVLCAVRVCCL
jgi:hypothetical protein